MAWSYELRDARRRNSSVYQRIWRAGLTPVWHARRVRPGIVPTRRCGGEWGGDLGGLKPLNCEQPYRKTVQPQNSSDAERQQPQNSVRAFRRRDVRLPGAAPVFVGGFRRGGSPSRQAAICKRSSHSREVFDHVDRPPSALSTHSKPQFCGCCSFGCLQFCGSAVLR